MNIQQCENKIRDGMACAAEALYKVGMGLAEVKDEKLYREEGFKTFDAYMQERWNVKRSRGYHLIYAAEVLGDLRDHFEGYQLPQTESAIRPLRSVPQEQRVEVWREALSRSSRPPGKGVVDAVIADLCA